MPADDAAYSALGRALVDALAPIVRDAVREAVQEVIAQNGVDQPFAVSPAEAAELLGVNRRTFYRRVMPFVYSGIIESGKIGRARRIDRASLLHWWERNKTDTL